MTKFRLQIVTQTKAVFDSEVISLVVPGEAGYFGILANHAPLVATLGKGLLRIVRAPHDEIECLVEGGFFEVHNNVAVLLPDRITGLGEERETD